MKHFILFILLVANFSICFSQNTIRITIANSDTREKMEGVSVIISGTNKGSISDSSGKLILNDLPDGDISIEYSIIGFKTKTIKYYLPLINTSVKVFLDKSENETMEEVIVSSSRNESRIENLPVKVEVLGFKEVNEEAGIKPGNITRLLGDVAGIQTQQTSAVTGNTDLRIQGLPGDYSQLLRDGMPLFGGFAGSFSALQIPPMDLKQIEIIKGASSTLYGGGAIAGMINIISKKPKMGMKERSLLFNQSTLRESNINVFLSERDSTKGYTFFGGVTYQREVDVDGDGFSDVASTENFFIHPTIFVYPNEKNTFSIGLNSVFEARIGGDMQVLIRSPNATHQFYIENQSFRNTLDFNWEKKIKTTDKFNLKASTSVLNRNITTNVFGMRARQFTFYSEASRVIKRKQHDIVAGINFNGELFKKRFPDSSTLNNYNYFTLGLFVQDDWRIHPKLTLETGLRTDFHNQYGTFILPRFSLLYKINSFFTTRLGGGLGYKTPTVFSNEVDERSYAHLVLDKNAKSEKSIGGNWDVTFKKEIGDVALTINQSFYFTQINDPLVGTASPNQLLYFTESNPITTKGFETWVQIGYQKLEAYLGYTLTDARKKYDVAQPFLELIAKNKFASVVSYRFLRDLTAGVEAAYTGRQYLDNGNRSPGYPLIAAMIRFDAGRLTFVLNGENLLDYRQTRKEFIYNLPIINPTFKQLWAPIDGRVINLSLKIQL